MPDAPLHIDVNSCQDHIAPGSGNDLCGAPVTTGSPDSIYAGTINGPLTVSTAPHLGGAPAGSCVDLLTVSAKVIQSSSDLGADGLPCTDDDFVAPIAPLSVPATTGTATATIRNAVRGPGTCLVGSNAGNACIENANCPSSTCSGAFTKGCVAPVGDPEFQQGCETNGDCSSYGNCQDAFSQGAVNGQGVSCASALASNLSGLAFVGGATLLNGPNPLGDATLYVRLSCQ